MLDSDAATLTKLVDIFVTVVDQKTLFSVVNSVGLLAVSQVDFFDWDAQFSLNPNPLAYLEPSAIGADKISNPGISLM